VARYDVRQMTHLSLWQGINGVLKDAEGTQYAKQSMAVDATGKSDAPEHGPECQSTEPRAAFGPRENCRMEQYPRPQDQIGFGAGRYVYNQHVAANQDRDQEIDFELNYVYQYSPALMIRPNLQYVYQPNGLASGAESWIAGLSVGLKF
jgi:hypothetical protein